MPAIKSSDLQAALAAAIITHVWDHNGERGCLEVTTTITGADGTVLLSDVANYLDDLPPPALAESQTAGVPTTKAEGTATIDHLQAEVDAPHMQGGHMKQFADAIKARIKELMDMGHTPSEATAKATTPTSKTTTAAHADAMAADAAAAPAQVAASGVLGKDVSVGLTGNTIGATGADLGGSK